MLLELFGLEEEKEDRISHMLRVQAPLYRRGPGYRFRWRFGRLPAPRRRRPWRDPLALLWQRHFIKCLPPGPASGGHIPSLLPRIPSWGRVFDLSLAEASRGGRHPVLGLCRSCRGRPTFGQTTVGKLCLHRPAPVLLGGVASRPLVQPALRAEPVFSC
jgi:hypothetical protein